MTYEEPKPVSTPTPTPNPDSTKTDVTQENAGTSTVPQDELAVTPTESAGGGQIETPTAAPEEKPAGT